MIDELGPSLRFAYETGARLHASLVSIDTGRPTAVLAQQAGGFLVRRFLNLDQAALFAVNAGRQYGTPVLALYVQGREVPRHQWEIQPFRE